MLPSLLLLSAKKIILFATQLFNYPIDAKHYLPFIHINSRAKEETGIN